VAICTCGGEERGRKHATVLPFELAEKLMSRGRNGSGVQALKSESHHIAVTAVLCTLRSWECQL